VDTLPWADGGPAYIQCKSGQILKVELQATMQVIPEGVRQFVRFTYGRKCPMLFPVRCAVLSRNGRGGTFAGTDGIAAPIGIIAGSALWGDTAGDDIMAAFKENPEQLQERLLTAFRVAGTAASLEIQSLSIASIHLLTPAEQKQRLLVYPAVEVAPRLKRAVQLAADGVPATTALQQADLMGISHERETHSSDAGGR